MAVEVSEGVHPAMHAKLIDAGPGVGVRDKDRTVIGSSSLATGHAQSWARQPGKRKAGATEYIKLNGRQICGFVTLFFVTFAYGGRPTMYTFSRTGTREQEIMGRLQMQKLPNTNSEQGKL
jgi:hypothetical protein